jgi:hypothetical protein
MQSPAVFVFALCIAFALLSGLALGQPPSRNPSPPPSCAATTISTNGSCPCPDVYLNVPNLSVDNITLLVDNLTAHVNLDVKLSSLLAISAGVDVSINKVELDIKGVKAELELDVRLGNIAKILDRALTTLDRNPNLLSVLPNAHYYYYFYY